MPMEWWGMEDIGIGGNRAAVWGFGGKLARPGVLLWGRTPPAKAPRPRPMPPPDWLG